MRLPPPAHPSFEHAASCQRRRFDARQAGERVEAVRVRALDGKALIGNLVVAVLLGRLHRDFF